MTVPAAVAEVYLGQNLYTATLGGVALAVLDGKYTIEGMNDDMTNNTSGGFYEDVPTIQKASGTMTVAFKGATPPTFVTNSVYALVIDGTPANVGANYFSGNARINKQQKPGVSVKEGVKYVIDWTSFGSFVEIKPA